MLAVTPNDELDAGPRKGDPGAERLCAVTRAVKPVDDLIRFVVGPDGVVPDLKRKLPGRGLWITADRATLKDAVAKNIFARGFKKQVRVSPELVDQTEQLLVRATLDALAIAGKAGLVAHGFSKVEAAVTHEKIVGLIHASDASADGIAKLGGALRRRGDAEDMTVIKAYTTVQLDLALGRSNVVHAALLAGPANDTFLTRFLRLERFRAGKSAGSGHGGERNWQDSRTESLTPRPLTAKRSASVNRRCRSSRALKPEWCARASATAAASKWSSRSRSAASPALTASPSP